MSKAFNDKGWKIEEEYGEIYINNDNFSNSFTYIKDLNFLVSSNTNFSKKPNNFDLSQIFKIFDFSVHRVTSIYIDFFESETVDFTGVEIDYQNIVLNINGDNKQIINNKFKNIVISKYTSSKNFRFLIRDILENGDFQNLCFDHCSISLSDRRFVRNLTKNSTKDFFLSGCIIERDRGDHDYYLNKIKKYQRKMLRNSDQNLDDFIEDVEYFSRKMKNIPKIEGFSDVFNWEFELIFNIKFNENEYS